MFQISKPAGHIHFGSYPHAYNAIAAVAEDQFLTGQDFEVYLEKVENSQSRLTRLKQQQLSREREGRAIGRRGVCTRPHHLQTMMKEFWS